jgi:hypothetical protein
MLPAVCPHGEFISLRLNEFARVRHVHFVRGLSSLFEAMLFMLTEGRGFRLSRLPRLILILPLGWRRLWNRLVLLRPGRGGKQAQDGREDCLDGGSQAATCSVSFHLGAS